MERENSVTWDSLDTGKGATVLNRRTFLRKTIFATACAKAGSFLPRHAGAAEDKGADATTTSEGGNEVELKLLYAEFKAFIAQNDTGKAAIILRTYFLQNMGKPPSDAWLALRDAEHTPEAFKRMLTVLLPVYFATKEPMDGNAFLTAIKEQTDIYLPCAYGLEPILAQETIPPFACGRAAKAIEHFCKHSDTFIMAVDIGGGQYHFSLDRKEDYEGDIDKQQLDLFNTHADKRWQYDDMMQCPYPLFSHPTAEGRLPLSNLELYISPDTGGIGYVDKRYPYLGNRKRW